jgi:predicted nucleic acid-binding Zn ribbon protein
MANFYPPFRSARALGPPKRDARQRVLAQWRGMDLAPVEQARALTARAASGVLPKLLEDLRLDRRQSEAQIIRLWQHTLDPAITAHAQPDSLRNGTLFVNVDSSVWLSEIVRYRRKEILDRLQTAFGRDTIKRVSFRVG